MEREKIEDILFKIGVSAGIDGFTYIVDAMEIIDDFGEGISITKSLYPSIAEKNKTTASRVERAIRHAFDSTRKIQRNHEIIEKYIGFTHCTNSASLMMLYKQIKKEFEKEKCKNSNYISEEIKLEIKNIVESELNRRIPLILKEIQNKQKLSE